MALYLDKRFTVNGQASKILQDNFVNLDTHIQNVMSNTVSSVTNNTFIMQIPLVSSDTLVTSTSDFPFVMVPAAADGYTVKEIRMAHAEFDPASTQNTEIFVEIGSTTREIVIEVGNLLDTPDLAFAEFTVAAGDLIKVDINNVETSQPVKGLTLSIELVKTV